MNMHFADTADQAQRFDYPDQKSASPMLPDLNAIQEWAYGLSELAGRIERTGQHSVHLFRSYLDLLDRHAQTIEVQRCEAIQQANAQFNERIMLIEHERSSIQRMIENYTHEDRAVIPAIETETRKALPAPKKPDLLSRILMWRKKGW